MTEFLPAQAGLDGLSSGFKSGFKKMTLIAGSCIAIALAGLLSRASFTTGEVASDIAAAVNPTTDLTLAPMVARPFEPAKAESVLPVAKPTTRVSREARFAERQVALYSTLLDTLQARMNEEPNSDHLVRMRAAVANLDQNLSQSRDSLLLFENATTKDDPFLRESLKGNLFALQEAGQRAVSVFVDADNFPDHEMGDALQVFNVSRTGQ